MQCGTLWNFLSGFGWPVSFFWSGVMFLTRPLCAPPIVVLVVSIFLLLHMSSTKPASLFFSSNFLSFSFSFPFCLCLRAALQFRAECRQRRQGKSVVISILNCSTWYVLFADGGYVHGLSKQHNYLSSKHRKHLSPGLHLHLILKCDLCPVTLSG